MFGNIGLKLLSPLSSLHSVVLSPFCIFIPLYVLLCGCTGETYREIYNFLNTSCDAKTTQILIDLINSFGKNNPLINRIYIRNGVDIKNIFVQKVGELNIIKNVDFNDISAKQISDWISEITRGTIKNAIPHINTNTVMMMLNIIQFNVNWKYQFDKSLTKEETFYGTTTKIVPFMKTTNIFSYHEDDVFQFVELPLKDDGFSMGLLLPKQKSIIIPTLQQLNYAIDNSTQQTVEVIIPKFEQTNKFNLNEILKHFGVKTLFKTTNSDFGRIFSEENKCVSQFIQQVYIKIDESGLNVNKIKVDNKKIIFHANHPFIYYVRHIPTCSFILEGVSCD